MAVDLLSDIFKLIHLTGALMFRFDLAGCWRIENAATDVASMAELLPAGTDQIIIFHIINEGECWFRHRSGEWMHAGAGDAVLLAHGHAHVMANLKTAAPVPFRTVLGDQSVGDLRTLEYIVGKDPRVQIVCGFLGCSKRAFAPLCASLPNFCKVSLGAATIALLRYALAETLDERPGANALRVRMAELLFMEALRVYLQGLPENAHGWLAGVRDPLVARAMRAFHEEPRRAWTVEMLATAVDSSRSSLAGRFRDVIGEAPMHYLTQLRMQLAANQLSERVCSIDTVASDVGYKSSAAFQRAFKRCFGIPPASWRSTVKSSSDQAGAVTVRRPDAGRGS